MDWKAHVRAAFEADSLPDDDVIDELAGHADAAYQSARAEGAEPADAARVVDAYVAAWRSDPAVLRRRPRRRAPDPAPPSSASRFAGLLHDVRHALRLLRRQPGYSALAVLTLALGITAATSLFSIAYGVLLKPLPWRDPDRIVELRETRRGSTSRFGPMMTNASYVAWRDRPSTIEEIAAWRASPMTLDTGGEPARIRVATATASLFPLLGVRPVLGSVFSPADEFGNDRVVLSYALWQEKFGGSHDALGRTMRLDGSPYRVVGVMPPWFSFPNRETRAWIPMRVQPVVVTRGGGSLSMFQAIARLRPGVTAAQAAAEATARARTAPDPGVVVMAIFGTRGAIEVSAIPWLEARTAAVQPAIVVFLAAVGLLLLAAGGNVANVQLARAASRAREIAIRSALGAGASRLVRQFLVEAAIIGSAAAVAGLGLTAAILRLLPSVLPPVFPRIDEVTLSVPVAAFAVAIALVTSIGFGLVPALHARRIHLRAALAEDGRAPAGDGGRTAASRARRVMMAGQVAVACVLLVGAMLLTRSFVALVNADPGYDAAHVLTAQIVIPESVYTPGARMQILTTLLDRIARVPGVTQVAFTTSLPLVPGDILGSFTMRSPRTGAEIVAQSAIRLVSPGYFAALRLRVLEGRGFSGADTATSAPVVVVNRSFARKYLSDRPVGDRLPVNFGGGVTEAQVVGVVDDVHHRSLTDPPAPELYESYLQHSRGFDYDAPLLVMRTAADPVALIPTLRAVVRQQDRALAFDSVATMENRVNASVASPRMNAVLLGAFAAFTLVIAAVGLFGVLGYNVAQRSREIGVRTALGARPLDIATLILKQGLAIAIAGVVVGLAVAFAAARSLSALLFGIAPHDSLSFALVPLVLLVVAGLACLVPARRAARVDPVQVLRG